MKNRLTQLFTIFTLCFLWSCSTETQVTIDYRKEIPTTVVDKIIVPRLDSLLSKSTSLHAAIHKLDTEFNLENFENAREYLNEVSLVYAKMYAFNIGEAKQQFMNRKLNFWPVYNISIEKTIEEGNFNKEFIANLGSAAKNLPGLNYLLFKDTDSQNAISAYTSNSNRLAYLLLVSDEFHERIQELHRIWSVEGADYASTLKNNTATGLLSSFNLIYNGLYNVIDNCKVTKLGKPAGLEKSSHTNPEIVESFYTQNSIELMYNNIISVEQVFFSTEITSISEYVKSILKNDELNNRIQENINTSKQLLSSISSSLNKAVDTDKEALKNIHEKLSELLVLLHTDVRSALSIIITGTDNDGD